MECAGNATARWLDYQLSSNYPVKCNEAIIIIIIMIVSDVSAKDTTWKCHVSCIVNSNDVNVEI